MSDTAPEILRRKASLAERFSELAGRLSQVARQLEAPGTPPSEAFVQEIADACRAFAELRADVVEAARAVSLPSARAEAIASLADIATVLEAVEAEEKRAALEAERQRAFALLDRVLALTHREDANFAALAACQAKAREARAAVAEAPSVDMAALKPFADLLTMVEGQVDDERWALLEDSVSTAFGRPLVAAATRKKLAAPR